jgi:hypothetical protein
VRHLIVTETHDKLQVDVADIGLWIHRRSWCRHSQPFPGVPSIWNSGARLNHEKLPG